MYGIVFSLLLRRMPAERAHHLIMRGLRLIQAIPGLAPLLRRLLGPSDPALRVKAFGLEFPGPIGLAAGFDKDAVAYEALSGFGFGFVEIGTVTGRAQPGNPAPRLFRLVDDRAIINRMGFNNEGAEAVAARLAASPGRRRVPGRSGRADGIVLGINIGKTKVVPEEEAISDYVRSTELLAPYADYLVVNVSSPNTPGLRNLQAVEHLRPLLSAVRQAADRTTGDGGVGTGHRVPLLVKIAPDLADDDIDAVADLALELGLDGIIATNTTITREGLASDPALVKETGGLSGAPLKERSLEVLTRLRARVGDRIALVSVGGVETADDAWERIRAGATLVQGYTSLIYGGPFWAAQMQRGLSRRLHASTFPTLAEASDAPK